MLTYVSLNLRERSIYCLQLYDFRGRTMAKVLNSCHTFNNPLERYYFCLAVNKLKLKRLNDFLNATKIIKVIPEISTWFSKILISNHYTVSN